MTFAPEPEERGEWTVVDAPAIDEDLQDRMAPVALFDNVYTLTTPRMDAEVESRAFPLASLAGAPATLDEFDEPERDRMYRLAVQFVDRHTRQVRAGDAIAAVDHSFSDDTIVVSEKQIPRLPLRVAKLNWAVEGGRVIDVKDHRTAVRHLRPTPIPPRRRIWNHGRGDRHDLAYVVANVCAILRAHVPAPIAVTGVVALETNQIPGGGRLDDERQAAADGGMAHLVLPFASHYMPGLHDGVRYWPARDVNEGLYSFLSAASRETAIPDLRRRWRVKMVYSWISLLAIFASIGAMQLADAFVGHADLLRWTLGVAATFFALSSFATHRYWRMDR